MKHLNANEQLVLQSLINAVKDATGNEFGFLDEAKRGKFSKHEFAGYISALKEKGVFEYLDSEGFTTNGTIKVVGQFALTEEAFNFKG